MGGVGRSGRCRRYGVPFLINDAADLAAGGGGGRCPVGQQDMSPSRPRPFWDRGMGSLESLPIRVEEARGSPGGRARTIWV